MSIDTNKLIAKIQNDFNKRYEEFSKTCDKRNVLTVCTDVSSYLLLDSFDTIIECNGDDSNMEVFVFNSLVEIFDNRDGYLDIAYVMKTSGSKPIWWEKKFTIGMDTNPILYEKIVKVILTSGNDDDDDDKSNLDELYTSLKTNGPNYFFEECFRRFLIMNFKQTIFLQKGIALDDSADLKTKTE
jgi:hypothetical protein